MGTVTLCFYIFWLVERTDSIWYPSLTLYRQPTLDDWDSVYASIRKICKKVGHHMNQTDKDNSITKAELEVIMNMYRQRRYDECIKQ